MSDNVLKSFGGFEIKDAAKGIVESIIATLGVVDKDKDVITAGAIADGSKVLMSRYGHDVVFGNAPVGKGTLRVQGDKVVFSGKVFLGTEAGRDTLEVLKEVGSMQQWSFGFRVLGSEMPSEEWRQKGAIRILTKLDAFEVSPVAVGAGVGTQTVSAKSEASNTDPFAEHAAEVAAIAEALEQEEIEELHRTAKRHIERVAEMEREASQREIDEIFHKFRSNSMFDPQPDSEQSYVVYKLCEHLAAFWGVPEKERPRVRWLWSPTSWDSRPKMGMYQPNTKTIFLLIGLKGEDLISTLGHEYEHFRCDLLGREMSEGAAEAVGDVLVRHVREGLVFGVKL